MLSQEVIDLANYRLNQAKDNIEEAEMLFTANKFKGASNRAYYAIFHAIKAVLALEQKDFKKHSSVIAYFNQEYISKEVFPRDLGKDITNIRLYREKSDYVDFYIITKEDCRIQIDKSKNIVSSIEKYLGNLAIDHFYSEENMKYLKKAIKDLDEGKGVEHDLIEVED